MDKKWSKKRVLSLLKDMTLREKIGQLNQIGGSIYGSIDDSNFAKLIREGDVGSFLTTMGAYNVNIMQKYNMENSRMKIPLMFASDVIHGIKTIFPTPLAESCSWDVELAESTAQMSAYEATAMGINLTYAPMVDICRDARWGRIVEGAGEDGLLGADFARARVKGFQGELIDGKVDRYHVGACIKHFACYGGAIAGKDYNSVEMSLNTANNYYFPPYKSGIDAGAFTVMSAFNTLNGVPCTANDALLNKLLRGKWKFDGLVVSDYDAVKEIVLHKFAKNEAQAAALAINSGVDIDMADNLYVNNLQELVNNKVVDIKTIDRAVSRVLTLKYRLGLFDNPYSQPDRQESDLLTDKAIKLSREAGQKSIVLLSNDGVLPIKARSKLLLVGSLASQNINMHGSWAYYDTVEHTVNIVDGLKKYYDVTYLPTYEGQSINNEQLAQAVQVAQDVDVVCVVAGETIHMAGEAASRTNIELSSCERLAIDTLSKCGKKIILLLVNGRPLALQNVADKVDGVLECWNLGSQMGNAVADVVVGNFNPQGKLTTTFPRVVGQCPLYYNTNNTGRPCDVNNKYTSKYLDVEEGALYPFGWGLTYSNVKIVSCKVDTTIVNSDDIIVDLTLSNDSNLDACETAQVYCSPLYCSSVVMPNKQLVGYGKVVVLANSTSNLTIAISQRNIGAVNDKGDFVAPQGQYNIMVGLSSDTSFQYIVEIK